MAYRLFKSLVHERGQLIIRLFGSNETWMRSECALSKDTATRTSLQDASRYASGSNYFLFSPLEKLLAFADSRETSLISRDETRLDTVLTSAILYSG